MSQRSETRFNSWEEELGFRAIPAMTPRLELYPVTYRVVEPAATPTRVVSDGQHGSCGSAGEFVEVPAYRHPHIRQHSHDGG